MAVFQSPVFIAVNENKLHLWLSTVPKRHKGDGGKIPGILKLILF